MAVVRLQLALVVIFLFFDISYPSTDIAPPPELTLNAIDVELKEEEDRHVDLFGAPIMTCADDDPTRGYIQSISPGTPCGLKCFQLQTCSGGGAFANTTEYCLFFLPSQGSLSFAATPLYTLTVACSDDVEPETVDSLTVTIVPNTPPVFQPPAPLTVNVNIDGSGTGPYTDLYTVNTNDVDSDPVFYTMSTTPSTDLLEIGYADGVIRSTTDLRFLCEPSIEARVTARDDYNPSIGPLTIDFTVDNANTAPSVNNLDITIEVDENVGAGTVVHTLDIVDDGIGTIITDMTSTSDAGLELFELVGDNIQLRIDPDYERSDTRSVRLYFDLTDGYCNSQTYTLNVNIRDVNEPPTWQVPRMEFKVYEGNIIEPGVDVVDEDIGDTATFSKIRSSGPFDVDPVSGEIFSTTEIDLDPNVQFIDTYFIDVRVTDKDGETADIAYLITVCDKNDNPPYFLQNPYVFGATECTDPGTVLGVVQGDDDDSEFQNNDAIYFGGSGGKMSVTSNGRVILTQACVDGEVLTASATVSDLGIFPNPLSGAPATISVTCGPCPPPVTAAPGPAPGPATTGAPATTTAAPGGGGGGDDGIAAFLGWLVPAIIGGLVWLALTSYFIYRYCCPCRNPCAGRCRRRPKRPKIKQQKPPKAPKKLPPPPPPALPKLPPPPPPPPKKELPPIPPPSPPPPDPDPYLFGFWKERYTDQDIIQNDPDRAAKPVPIEKMPEDIIHGNQPPPENLKIGNPVGQQDNVPPAKPADAPKDAAGAAAGAAPKKKKK